MTGPILVINPNSNQAVTDGMDAALAGFRLQGGPEVECVTLAEGPFGIESQLDADCVIPLLAKLVERRRDASAIVIACYSDPGIDACRSVATQPVFGIQECGVLTALARGERFGVLAIAQASIARQCRYLRRLGLTDRFAGARPTNLSVDESATSPNAFSVLSRVGNELREDGADVLILGCAGMARHRLLLEEAMNLPVIDPVQAAVAMALGTACATR